MRKVIGIIIFFIALIFVLLSEPQGNSILNNDSQKKITFWGIYDLPEVYNPIIGAFQREHPDLEIKYKQYSNASEYHEVLFKQLEKGKGPDIFLFQGEDLEIYKPHLNPSNADLAEGFAPLAETALVENRLLYGLPLWVDSLMLFYNKRYYRDGLRENWYEFAEQTRDINLGGIAMGRLDNLKSGWDILKTLFLQKGVDLSTKPEENLYDTLDFFTRFAYAKDKYFNWNEKLNKDYPDEEVDSFVRRKVAAIAGYSSLADHINIKIDQLQAAGATRIKRDDLAFSTFPQFDSESPKYLAKYYALGVSVYADHPNLAWEFISFMTNAEQADYFRQATGRTPGRLLDYQAGNNEIGTIQKKQLANSYTFSIGTEIRAAIEDIVQRSLTDREALRELMELDL